MLGLGKGSGRDVEDEDRMEDDPDGSGREGKGRGRDEWVEVAIDVPGMRDDDALPVFLSAMLTEALLADGGLKDRLWINRRFHWRLYIDVSNLALLPTDYLILDDHLPKRKREKKRKRASRNELKIIIKRRRKKNEKKN